jgi:hypothetical protein
VCSSTLVISIQESDMKTICKQSAKTRPFLDGPALSSSFTCWLWQSLIVTSKTITMVCMSQFLCGSRHGSEIDAPRHKRFQYVCGSG